MEDMVQCASCGAVFSVTWVRHYAHQTPTYCPFCGDEPIFKALADDAAKEGTHER